MFSLVIAVMASVSATAIARPLRRAATVKTATAVPAATTAEPDEAEFTECRRYPPDKRFKLTLKGEVGLTDLVALVADIGCRTILVGPGVALHAGKVTIDAPDAVSAPEVYRIFRSSLEVQGLTIERSGALWKVVDAARAKEVSTLTDDAAAPSSEQFVTRVMRVHHSTAAEVGEILAKMRSRDGDVSVYAPAQSLILTDRASNVRRMEELAGALDVAQPGERVWTVAVHAQGATELAATIAKVLEATHRSSPAPGAAHAQGGPSIIPVDGAHVLVVVGDEPEFRRVAALADRLDPPVSDGGTSQVHVIYLAHTNAEEMATTLKEIGLSSRGGRQPSTPATGVGPQGEVRVSADKVANAIVVFAGGPDFLMVRDLVTRLDLPRRQVYVEAVILDLSVDKARQLGVGFHGGEHDDSGNTGFVASESRGVSSLVSDATSLASLFGTGGLTTGVFGKSFSFAGVTVPSFGVVLKALEQSKDVSVISQPHLLTIDNTKASLSVGQSIPFPTQTLGSTVSGTATPSVLSSYQRQDVALKLELTPHLNDSDSIRLELDGEISDVPDGQSSSAAGGPTTNKRTIKTSVVVDDGETIVLGGLEKESESETIQKVPWLGDIPILGRLFQYRAKERIKQNLMIAITPYVIRGPEDLRRIFERKQHDQQEFDECFNTGKKADYARIDYRRKRGLLQEINAIAKKAEEEAHVVADAERGRTRPPLVGEVK